MQVSPARLRPGGQTRARDNGALVLGVSNTGAVTASHEVVESEI
jgi:hypothetical protein